MAKDSTKYFLLGLGVAGGAVAAYYLYQRNSEKGQFEAERDTVAGRLAWGAGHGGFVSALLALRPVEDAISLGTVAYQLAGGRHSGMFALFLRTEYRGTERALLAQGAPAQGLPENLRL